LVVNRATSGAIRDNCDSLLFSSLLQTALHKLGKTNEAEELWQNIQQAAVNKGFVRHPDCADKATSRDQILGLLVTLSQQPEGYQATLEQLFLKLKEEKGYFSHGSPSVSYMTPGLADIFRRFARIDEHPYHSMPEAIRRSFSTLELSVQFAKRGYRTHLSAMQIWLEMELSNKHPRLPMPRTILEESSFAFDPFVPRRLESQRIEYVTQSLVEREPENMFYRYLRFKSARAINPAVRYKMMAELLAMPQFPDNRLPADCDRKADYLWQRDGSEYKSNYHKCTVVFSGVDFLWMAGLLLDNQPTNRTAGVLH
jgi:hypothetical protein